MPNKKQHELEVAVEKQQLVCTVGNKCLLIITVQNELENITVLFENFKKKGQREGKALKLLIVSDQRGIILIVMTLKVL